MDNGNYMLQKNYHRFKILYILILLFVFNIVNANEYIVKGKYSLKESVNKKNNELIWNLKTKEGKISFYLKDKLVSECFYKDNKILKIVEYKVFKGKRRKFEVSGNKIDLVLKYSKIPYKFALNLRNKNFKKLKNSNDRFTLIKEIK